MSLINFLLNLTALSRIRLWLRLHYPGWYTTEEIAKELPIFSKQRIQQILQNASSSGLVHRRDRKTNKPGPNPYEYQVPPLLFNELEDEQLERLDDISK